MKSFLNVLRWLFGILLCMSALGGFAQGEAISASLMLAFGLLLLPPVSKALFKKKSDGPTQCCAGCQSELTFQSTPNFGAGYLSDGQRVCRKCFSIIVKSQPNFGLQSKKDFTTDRVQQIVQDHAKLKEDSSVQAKPDDTNSSTVEVKDKFPNRSLNIEFHTKAIEAALKANDPDQANLSYAKLVESIRQQNSNTNGAYDSVLNEVQEKYASFRKTSNLEYPHQFLPQVNGHTHQVNRSVKWNRKFTSHPLNPSPGSMEKKNTRQVDCTVSPIAMAGKMQADGKAATSHWSRRESCSSRRKSNGLITVM